MHLLTYLLTHWLLQLSGVDPLQRFVISHRLGKYIGSRSKAEVWREMWHGDRDRRSLIIFRWRRGVYRSDLTRVTDYTVICTRSRCCRPFCTCPATRTLAFPVAGCTASTETSRSQTPAFLCQVGVAESWPNAACISSAYKPAVTVHRRLQYTEFQGTSPTAACQSLKSQADNISARPAVANCIFCGFCPPGYIWRGEAKYSGL